MFTVEVQLASRNNTEEEKPVGVLHVSACILLFDSPEMKSYVNSIATERLSIFVTLFGWDQLTLSAHCRYSTVSSAFQIIHVTRSFDRRPSLLFKGLYATYTFTGFKL
jgi:hypothetical protein